MKLGEIFNTYYNKKHNLLPKVEEQEKTLESVMNSKINEGKKNFEMSSLFFQLVVQE